MTSTNPNAPSVFVGPLIKPKTIMMKFVPDWLHSDLNSPLRAASLCVLFGPANTTPETATWSFEFNIMSVDSAAPADKSDDVISNRALLWQNGKPFGKLKNCVVLSGCSFPDPSLAPASIILRPNQNSPLSLKLRNLRVGERKDLSYLKIFKGFHYYFNMTFPKGSLISEYVRTKVWAPYLLH